MPEKFDITLNINGRDYAVRTEARRTLVDVIRDDCGLTGTHIGCEHAAPISAASTAYAAPAPSSWTTRPCAPA